MRQRSKPSATANHADAGADFSRTSFPQVTQNAIGRSPPQSSSSIGRRSPPMLRRRIVTGACWARATVAALNRIAAASARAAVIRTIRSVHRHRLNRRKSTCSGLGQMIASEIATNGRIDDRRRAHLLHCRNQLHALHRPIPGRRVFRIASRRTDRAIAATIVGTEHPQIPRCPVQYLLAASLDPGAANATAGPR